MRKAWQCCPITWESKCVATDTSFRTTMNTLDLFRHDFVLSIKPEYATKIVDGLKTVELRRRFPYGTVTGARIYVYATAPLQAVIGFATIREVQRSPVEQIWAAYHHVAYINRKDFDDYYSNVDAGYVLMLQAPVRLKEPIGLEVLKSKLNFVPPQSFAYADEAFHRLVHGE
jgi:predicted transcriptional regulator